MYKYYVDISYTPCYITWCLWNINMQCNLKPDGIVPDDSEICSEFIDEETL
jgi:hypothetical protein